MHYAALLILFTLFSALVAVDAVRSDSGLAITGRQEEKQWPRLRYRRALQQATPEEREALGVDCFAGCLQWSCEEEDGSCIFLKTWCRPAIGGTSCKTSSAPATQWDVQQAEAGNAEVYKSLKFTPLQNGVHSHTTAVWALLLAAVTASLLGV